MRVLLGQVVVKFAVFSTFVGMSSILLPLLVADLDPVGKVGALAAVVAAGQVVNAASQPIVGALSDRTSSRFGRRLPWMVAGALVGGLAVGSIGGAPTVLVIGVLWALTQLGLNALEVAADAYLVDEFAAPKRGRAAGVVGLALIGGTATGALVTGTLSDRPSTVTWLLAALVGVALVVFVVLVRDEPTVRVDRPRRSIRSALRSVVTVPSGHPDVVRVLVWRVGYSIAYGAVFTFLLYIVTDHIGVPEAEAPRVMALAAVLAGAASAVSVVAGGWLSDRIGRRLPFIVAGNAVLIVGDVLLLLAPSVPTAFATAVLFGIGLGLSISCGRALASDVLPVPLGGAATALGTLSTAAAVGQIAAPAIGALAIGIAGYPGAFVVSIVGAIACSVAVALVRSVR